MAAWSPERKEGKTRSPLVEDDFCVGWTFTVLAQEQRFPDPILQHRVRPFLARTEKRPTMKQMIRTQIFKQLETDGLWNPTLLIHPGPSNPDPIDFFGFFQSHAERLSVPARRVENGRQKALTSFEAIRKAKVHSDIISPSRSDCEKGGQWQKN